MSIIQLDIPDAKVLDLFAGSGALGIESLSRGAQSATFVDASARSLKILRKNLEALDAGNESDVHQMDAIRFVKALPAGAFDIAFADPPY